MRHAHCARSIGIGVVLEIGFEDRLKEKHDRGLHHPVPNGRDSEGALTAAGLRDHYPSYRLWTVGLVHQFLPKLGQPTIYPVRLDVIEPDTIDASSAGIGFRLPICLSQGLRPAHFVVQRVEPIVRLLLGLLIKLLPESLDLIGF